MRDNLSYAKEHTLSTDDSAPVLSSVPAAATPAATLVWDIAPPRAWTDAPIVSRPTVGHSLLRQAAVSFMLDQQLPSTLHMIKTRGLAHLL